MNSKPMAIAELVPSCAIAAWPFQEGPPSDARVWLPAQRRKRFVATTDSDHNGPIFSDLVRDKMIDGPN